MTGADILTWLRAVERDREYAAPESEVILHLRVESLGVLTRAVAAGEAARRVLEERAGLHARAAVIAEDDGDVYAHGSAHIKAAEVADVQKALEEATNGETDDPRAAELALRAKAGV